MKFDPSGWSDSELKNLADRIYDELRLKKQVNLEEELLDHYHRCKDSAVLAHQALESGAATAGAAAVLSATTGALKELARLQTDVYNAERVRVLERCMTDALKQAENADEVLAVFERLVGQEDGAK